MEIDVALEYIHLKSGLAPGANQMQTRTVGTRELRIAIDGGGSKHLLMPAPGRFTPDVRSRGVHLVERPYVLDGHEVLFADLYCADPALDMVFDRLAQDVVMLAEQSDTEPLAACQQVLEQWRELLRRGTDLSEGTIVGLIGELHILSLLAERDPSAALEAWTGPRRTIHDFVRHDHALEVKSTSSLEGTSVKINGWDQLDPADVHSLHLAVVHCRPSDTAPSLDERIRALTELGIPLQPLLSKIALTGYVYEARQPLSTRYRIAKVSLWEVGDNFPGLRRSSMSETARKGVSQLQYVLATDSAPSRLTDLQQEAFLDGWLRRG